MVATCQPSLSDVNDVGATVRNYVHRDAQGEVMAPPDPGPAPRWKSIINSLITIIY